MGTYVKPKILVVDDHEDNLSLLSCMLAVPGYDVSTAKSGELALATVAAGVPDLILLDVKMPQMNGYEVCRRLKADACTRDIPVLFISALHETGDRVEGFAVGGVDYITKPFEPDEVLARVRTHLHLRELTLQLEQKIGERTATLQEEIAERKRAEEAQRQLNRKLRAIDHCNQVLLRATDERSLLNDICRIICEQAGYLLAWVGYAGVNGEKGLQPVAWAGRMTDEGSAVRPVWAENPECGCWPAAAAFRGGEVVLVQDIVNEPRMKPWCKFARQFNYRAVIALPLRQNENQRLGVLVVHSEIPGSITPDEVELLKGLAANLAYGIAVLGERAARQEAEQRSSLLSFALDHVHEGAFLIDLQGRFVYVNQEACRSLEYSKSELLDMTVPDIDPDFPPEQLAEKFAVIRRLGVSTFETRHRSRAGNIFPVEITASQIEYGETVYLLALVRNISERKKAEESLRASYERFEELFNKAAVPLCIVNKNAAKLTVNTRFEQTFGYCRQEIPTLNEWWPRAYPDPDYRAWVLATCENALQEAVAAKTDIEPIEYQVTCKNGDVRDMVVFGSAIGDDFLISFFDVTARKQAEQERLASLRFFESMDRINRAIQGSDDLNQMMSDVLATVQDIFNCDRAYLCYPCDPDAECWWIPMEHTRPEYPGGFSLGSKFPMDSDVRESVRRLLSTDGPLQFGPGTDNPLPTEVAEAFGIRSCMAMAIRPKLDKPWQFGIHQCSHVSRWSAAEERLFEAIGRRIADRLDSLISYRDLQKSEAQYRNIVETTNEGIWVLDADGLTRFVNARLSRMLGYAGEELLGRPFTDFVFGEDIPDHLRKMENRRRGLAETYEQRIRHKEERTLWIFASATPVFNEAGQFDGSLVMLTDISERKRIEDSLRAKREQLAMVTMELSLAEERERLRIASILHDHIGQLLLLGRIKLGGLSALKLPEEVVQTVVGTRDILEQAARDVHSLTVQMHPPVLGLAGLGAALEWLGKQMAVDFGLQVEFHDDRQPKPLGEELASVLYQCARELLINVAKHAETDHARLWVGQRGNALLLMVEDSGVGFDPAIVGCDRNREMQFGLFSIQIRIERLGGETVIHSVPGRGSRIEIHLPLTEAAIAQGVIHGH